MSHNRAERLLDALRSYGNSATLGQLLDCLRDDGSLLYKLSASISEAREELKLKNPPLTIVCRRGKTPSDNKYSVEPLLELFSKQED